jgi:hypothetical protein
MDKEKFKIWLESEILKYQRDMEEAERLHLWHIREKYFLYCRAYRKCIKKLESGNGTNHNGEHGSNGKK